LEVDHSKVTTTKRFKKELRSFVLMALPIKHEHGRTPGGLLFERYVSDRRGGNPLTLVDLEYVLLAGANVSPGKIEDRARHFYDYHASERSNYFGAFPAMLAHYSGRPVMIVYQAGVSGGEHQKRFYSPETSQLQLEEGLANTHATRVYPITHSLSSLTGLDIVTGAEYASDARLMGGTISSVLTNAEDALSENNHPRRLAGIKWISLMRAARKLNWTLPVYPLARQYWHDGEDQAGDTESWGALKELNLRSANYFLQANGLEKAQQPKVKEPLLLITTQDKIFSVDEQLRVAAALKAEVIGTPAGHRWFTLPQDKLRFLTKRIIIHSGVEMVI
jgi:hypothetical protein